MSIAQTSAPARTATVFTPREADWVETLPGELLLVRVRAGDVGGRYSMVESVAAPGAASPAHYHAEDEVFQVLSGTMTFMLDGEIISAPEGSTVVIPAGVPHSWKNRTSTAVRVLATFTPGGVEAFLESLGGLAPDAIPAFAATFGTVVVGPPLD